MFEALARLALTRRWHVLGTLLVLTALAAWAAFPLRIEGDLVKLLPKDDPAARALAELRASPGGEGAVIVAAAPGTDLDALARRVEALDTVRAAFWRLDPPLARKIALMQLDAAAIDDLTLRVRGALVAPSPLVQARLLAGLEDRFPQPPELLPADTLLVLPTRPNTDANFSLRLLNELETAVPDAEWMVGPHLTIAQSVQGIRQDLPRTSLLSLVLVCLVAGLSFRDPRAVAIVLAPLLPSVVVSLAAVQVFVGYVDTYTSLGSAVIFGLGIDFGVHLVARYQEDRRAGLEPAAAVVRAWGAVGPPCATAAVTSAAGFFALLTGRFQGLQNLGFTLAVGVMTCLVVALGLLPVLLVWLDPKGRAPAPRHPWRWRLTWALPVGAVVTVLALVSARGLQVETDLGALRRVGQAWDELSPRYQMLRQVSYPPVVVTTPDVRGEHARLAAILDEMPHVRGVLSVASVIPEDVDARSAALARLVDVARDPRAARLAGPIAPVLAHLREIDPAPLSAGDLPAGLQFLVGASADRVLLLVQGNLQDLREARALHDELQGRVDHAANEFLAISSMLDIVDRDLPRVGVVAFLAVGLLAWFDLRRPRLLALALGGLLVGLVWAGGALALAGVRLNFANVVALPILVGIGVDVVIHLLHRLEVEARQGGPLNLAVGRAIRTTGRAALVSVLTTVLAFASLRLAGNRGVQSIGDVVVVGLSAVFVAGALLVPAVWERLRARALPGA